MATIAELETEHGNFVYLNPRHVVSIIGADGVEPPVAVIVVSSGGSCRVKGSARDVACHLLAEDLPGSADRVALISAIGSPLRKERLRSLHGDGRVYVRTSADMAQGTATEAVSPSQWAAGHADTAAVSASHAAGSASSAYYSALDPVAGAATACTGGSSARIG